MSRIPGRRIDEIIELHKRHGGELQEIFVEGLEDKFFFEAFLRNKGFRDVSVMEINSVEIPTSEVIRLGLSDGNRSRVITLAALLEGSVDVNEVVCIADADFDHCTGTPHPYELLLLTDGTSIELYAFTQPILQKILSIIGGFPKSVDLVISELETLLTGAFLLRLAADGVGIVGSYPQNHSSFCSNQDGVLEFRIHDYSVQSFSGLTNREWKQQVFAKMTELEPSLPQEVRKRVHGHDFKNTLVWYIRQHPPHKTLNPSTFGQLLLGLIDTAELDKEALFVELLRRLNLKRNLQDQNPLPASHEVAADA